MAQQFTETERAVLRIVQADLPDSLTPYADIARTVGCTEEEVLDLLSRLKQSGAIRRFGASIKHQKTGWNHNAMVGWKVAPELVEECGTIAAPATATSPMSTTVPAPLPTGPTSCTPWCTAAANRNASTWRRN